MSGQDDDSEKSFEPTPQKIQKAREKGDVAKSQDLSVAAAYAGLVIALFGIGVDSFSGLGSALMSMIDQPDRLAEQVFGGSGGPVAAGLMASVGRNTLPLFVVPFAMVLLCLIAQKAIVVAPSKLEPKLSRLSVISNAKNKFGRAGLFEFGKSFAKLMIYSVILSVYMKLRLPDMISTAGTNPFAVVMLLAKLSMEFLVIALLIATAIGVVDAAFQHAEHRRKLMMSRKEIMDEMKDSEGDPHFKGKRRQRGQEIALSQMIGAVPDADVVIVNPTHYAVALQWDRTPGSAPVCVAKGVDEVAAQIRRVANENAVPIHSDPPTARALHATVEIGDQIHEEYFAPVAAAIRFAEDMRQRAKGKI
jgi:flagellar biosynthetic protein FlhB